VTGGVTVNSVTYVDPTHVTLNLNTTTATEGAQNVTVTNPDGQFVTGAGILGTGNATPNGSPTPTPTPSPTPLPSPSATPPTATDPFGVISSPTAGTTLTGSSVTFSWTKGTATAYWLSVGDERVSEPGGSNIFSSGQTSGTVFTVTNIPTDGRTIYVRLSSLVNGVWYNPPQDVTYTANPTRVLTPALSPTSGTFKKKAVISVTGFTPGSTLRFTTDGTDPTIASTLYSGPVTITKKGTNTFKAKAFKTGVPDSVAITGTYKIK
jgi:hypothetical protein